MQNHNILNNIDKSNFHITQNKDNTDLINQKSGKTTNKE